MAIIEFTQLSAFVKLTSETRVFKKDIEYFIGEFIEDCDLFVLLNPQQGDVREARRALREAQRYSC